MATLEQTLSEGWKIHQGGNLAEAERVYQQALALNPNSSAAWCYFGIALHDQQRYDEAVAAYQRALSIKPEFPICLNNLGNTYRLQKRLDDAIRTFDQALSLQPDYLIAHKNKGTTLCWEGRIDAALQTYQGALKFAPDDAEIHKHIAILKLLLGDFAGGWPEYEWRWKTGEIKLPEIPVSQWDGSSLDGKTILLTPEQGLGDTIHFVRYAAWLKGKYNCRVLFHSPKALRELLSSCQGIDLLLTDLNDPPPVDWFAPLMHVPGVLRNTPDEFPVSVPYLFAEQPRIDEWRENLADYPGRKIGIAWRGSATHQADSMRSIPLAEFAPLGRLQGAHFFSLQKGPPREELNTLAGRLDVVDLGATIDEGTGAFVETAAVLKNLDLLITCDTAIAHVAGALGVPVWLALSNVPDWRWLLDRDTTPWYPTMRLFRQTEQGDWTGVMNQVAAALEQEFPELRKKRPDEYHLLTTGFNRLTRTRQGLVLYNRHDRVVGRSLDRYGEFSASEVDLFQQSVRPGWTVIESGAHQGVHTLALSRLVGARGTVYAFEPNRLAFQTLCANLALNSVTNVFAPEALGQAAGSLELALPGSDPEPQMNESVPVVTLDSLHVSRCEFLKIKGREIEVVQGAQQTLERLRPILYIETNGGEQSSPLIELLLSLRYRLFWHLPPLFDQDNFYANDQNEFGPAVSVNVLGIHSSVVTQISGLREITSPDSDWRLRKRQ